MRREGGVRVQVARESCSNRQILLSRGACDRAGDAVSSAEYRDGR